MSLYNGPPRAGARGGKDQFNWDSVKTDQFRENYLGHSVKASVGRWQKGRDILWYTREKNEDDSTLQDELAAVKAREEDMMLEALGMKPKRRKPVEVKSRLDANEMKTLLQRGGPEMEEGAAAGADPVDPEGEGVRGLGYAPGAVTSMPTLEAGTDRLEGTTADPLPPPPPPLGSGGWGPGNLGGVGQGDGLGIRLPGPPTDKESLRKLRKLRKKAEKAARKESKKSKKKHSKKKKERKEKDRKRSPSSSSSDSQSDEERPTVRMASREERPVRRDEPHERRGLGSDAYSRPEGGERREGRDGGRGREAAHRERGYGDERGHRRSRSHSRSRQRSRSPVAARDERQRERHARHSPERHRSSRRY